jgi:hypothetical protein
MGEIPANAGRTSKGRCPGFFTFSSEAFAEMQIIEIIIVRIINRELHKK